MTHIDAMKQGLEALEEAVHYTSAPVWSPSMTKECNEAIASLRQAIAEAEGQEKALQALHAENERLGLYKDAYAEQEPVARAWDEGYRFGVNDERMSEANIGIAGMGMKVEPARNNPYRTTPPQRTEQEPVAIDGNTSDGYHTFNELYEFRKAYNAALFNEWAAGGKCSVHKSWRHHDGELCFGGGWFIVVAVLPNGQISNHYETKDWDLFNIPETECALFEFDGHTSTDVVTRLKAYTRPPQRTEPFFKFRECEDSQTGIVTSPQRTWVGLTDEDIDEWTPEIHVVIKAIESKLKQKNGYAEKNT